MAKEEHLKILRQGVKVWNEWRIDVGNVCYAQILAGPILEHSA
jgi:hypothetical protein